MITDSELELIAGENPENSVIQRLVEGYRYACNNIRAELRLDLLKQMDRELAEQISKLLGQLALEKVESANAKSEIKELRLKLTSLQEQFVQQTRDRIADLETGNATLREAIMQLRRSIADLNDIVLDYRKRYG